jgi:hypothetical protein
MGVGGVEIVYRKKEKASSDAQKLASTLTFMVWRKIGMGIMCIGVVGSKTPTIRYLALLIFLTVSQQLGV